MISKTESPIVTNDGTAFPPQGAPSHAIPVLDRDTLRSLRALLEQSGYAAAQDIRDAAAAAALQNPPFRLHVLRRLFARGETVPSQDAREALAPLDPRLLIEAGLMEPAADGVRARFQVQVFAGLLFIADFMPHDHPADLVLPIGPSGKYLASLTVRRPIATALDLGCGCGIQALLIARHAQHVTATDINPRAAGLTRLNAALNAIDNLEVLEGSYFEPVRGRCFDLIVANLPYVITPEKRYVYRDLGRSDDAPIRQNVQQVPAYLNEGGYAQLMLNWIHRADQPWWEPVEEWTANQGVDAWLTYSSSKTPEQYAEQWLTISAAEKPAEHAEAKSRWLEWYARNSIQRIAFGALTLRKRSGGSNWRCSLRVSNILSEPLGDHILQLFTAQDYLSSLGGPDGLLDRKLCLWHATIEPAAQDSFVVRSLAGFRVEQFVGAGTARLISSLDGTVTMRDAMENVAVSGSWTDQQRAATLNDIYRLLNLGLMQGAG